MRVVRRKVQIYRFGAERQKALRRFIAFCIFALGQQNLLLLLRCERIGEEVRVQPPAQSATLSPALNDI